MKKNYVFIDYENVQPETLDALDRENVRIVVFIGTKQTRIPVETVLLLQSMGERAQYVQITGNGPDALDFHIAFYTGLMAAQEPDAYFHIISKDTGFDPLIQHLKDKKIRVSRVDDVSEIPLVKAANAKTTQDQLGTVIEHLLEQATNAKTTQNKQAANSKTTQDKLDIVIQSLQQRGASRPKTTTALANTILSIFKKTLSEEEVALIVRKLQEQGIITVKETKVSYTLPE